MLSQYSRKYEQLPQFEPMTSNKDAHAIINNSFNTVCTAELLIDRFGELWQRQTGTKLSKELIESHATPLVKVPDELLDSVFDILIALESTNGNYAELPLLLTDENLRHILQDNLLVIRKCMKDIQYYADDSPLSVIKGSSLFGYNRIAGCNLYILSMEFLAVYNYIYYVYDYIEVNPAYAFTYKVFIAKILSAARAVKYLVSTKKDRGMHLYLLFNLMFLLVTPMEGYQSKTIEDIILELMYSAIETSEMYNNLCFSPKLTSEFEKTLTNIHTRRGMPSCLSDRPNLIQMLMGNSGRTQAMQIPFSYNAEHNLNAFTESAVKILTMMIACYDTAVYLSNCKNTNNVSGQVVEELSKYKFVDTLFLFKDKKHTNVGYFKIEKCKRREGVCAYLPDEVLVAYIGKDNPMCIPLLFGYNPEDTCTYMLIPTTSNTMSMLRKVYNLPEHDKYATYSGFGSYLQFFTERTFGTEVEINNPTGIMYCGQCDIVPYCTQDTTERPYTECQPDETFHRFLIWTTKKNKE